MSLFQQFQQFIVKENLFSAKDKLLLAVSGGIDSVVLCELCQQAGYDFVMAHCNFQLRAEESERDEAFVRGMAASYQKQVLIKRFSTSQYAADNKVSVQVAARELRYEWFFSLMDGRATGAADASLTNNASLTTHHSPLPAVLLTAHHLDDNIETLLMNFFKGTGVAGLRGILPRQGKLVRPLLFAKKQALVQFAAAHQLTWMEDSSNQSDKYARNYFRNQLIPFINNIYPEAENNLAHSLDRFREVELLYRQAVELHKKQLLEQKGNEIHIPVLKLKKAVPLHSIVYEISKQFGFGPQQTNGIIDLLESETGRYLQSPSHRIIKNRNWLIISPINTAAAATIVIEAATQRVVFEEGVLELVHLQAVPQEPQSRQPGAASQALLDAREISFPLLLRKWKTGDYFYPLGMKKKKKLARFFIDQKLSKTAKEKIWVLEAGKKIVWVIGQRIDERCKIVPSTKNALQVTLKAFDV